MENLGLSRDFWCGKRVLLTGHTGFKGGWTALMLKMLGAKIHGLSLPPAQDAKFFHLVDIGNMIDGNTFADIGDYQSCFDVIREFKPDVIIHMAAQALVRESYSYPLETYMTNVIGVVNVLEAVRQVESVEVVVNVTTDKCYKNNEWLWPYREDEALGGFDPYSSSKACSEIVSAAYRDSFLSQRGVRLATARAGNVVGGGDGSKDRLLPDLLRSLDTDTPISIRSPLAIRPWQHVLEPVTGYLMLAQKLGQSETSYSEAWNFGPEEVDCWTVGKVASHIFEMAGKGSWDSPSDAQPHEAQLLKLDSSKAKTRLGWRPKWRVNKALQKTIDWHKMSVSNSNMHDFSVEQIREYFADYESK